MSAGEPQIRALLTQSIAATLPTLAEGKRAEIVARVGGGLLAELDAQFPVAWGPMSRHMCIADAIRDVAGPRELVRLFRASMLQSWDRPLLRGIVKTSMDILGASPLSLVRQCERTYLHITQGLGGLRGEGSGTSAHMSLRGFPSKRYRFECYVDGLQGSLESIFPLFRVQGTVTVADLDEARGDVNYEMRW